MTMKLAAAVNRAMDAVRASNPVEATRLIQRAFQAREGKDTHSYEAQPPAHNLPDLPDTSHSRSEQSRFNRPYRRAGLAETIAALRSFKMPGDAKRRRPDNAMPESANFAWRNFACATGQRDFRLFVPSSPKPCGLVVMLHGCQQTAEDFALGTNMNVIAEEHDLLVAYPCQPSTANPSSCWNWFRPQDQAPMGGEAEIIARLTQSLVSEFGMPPQNVFVAGLSAGGAMAAVLGSTYPSLYSAVGVHSGLAYKSAHDVNTAFAAMRGQLRLRPVETSEKGFLPRLIIFHGSADQTVAPANATALWNGAVRSKGPGEVLELRVSAGGRTVERRIFAEPADVASVEEWIIHGSGHSWSGGNPQGSFTDATGPNASAEMVRFFLDKHMAALTECKSP
jgi:poly(hydroxyalkanoate) depolymerase family esterase